VSRPTKAQARGLVWFMYGSFGRRSYSCDVVFVVVCCFLCEAKNSSLSTPTDCDDEAPKTMICCVSRPCHKPQSLTQSSLHLVDLDIILHFLHLLLDGGGGTFSLLKYATPPLILPLCDPPPYDTYTYRHTHTDTPTENHLLVHTTRKKFASPSSPSFALEEEDPHPMMPLLLKHVTLSLPPSRNLV
jgi:hypothetical protein